MGRFWFHAIYLSPEAVPSPSFPIIDLRGWMSCTIVVAIRTNIVVMRRAEGDSGCARVDCPEPMDRDTGQVVGKTMLNRKSRTKEVPPSRPAESRVGME